MRHGYSKTRIYHIWQSMIQRCENKKHVAYPRYGGRGINVCDEWHEPATFISWALLNGYQEGLTIDRKDNGIGYEPSNCRFVTRKVQGNNRRDNISVDGRHVSDIASDVGLSYHNVYRKVSDGYSLSEITSLNKGKFRKSKAQENAIINVLKDRSEYFIIKISINEVASITGYNSYVVFRTIHRLIDSGLLEILYKEGLTYVYKICID